MRAFFGAPYRGERTGMYVFLDYFLTIFHSILVLFVLGGWAWKRTRGLHLAAIGLTVLSWFGLGAFFGLGYCPFTSWHWQVKRELGETDLPHSYITYNLDRLTGLQADPYLIDIVTLFVGLSAFALSAWLNWKDWNSARSSQTCSSTR